jgi:hypothetical protein
MLMVGTGITYTEHCTVYCGWHDVFSYTPTVGKPAVQVPELGSTSSRGSSGRLPRRTALAAAKSYSSKRSAAWLRAACVGTLGSGQACCLPLTGSLLLVPDLPPAAPPQVPFGMVGNVARCYPICSIYKNAADRSAPNHPEIDGTASIFAHEVVEAVSNPGTGGW